MIYENMYFIIGNAYAGKSTMLRLLSEKYHGILCEENYHNKYLDSLDKNEYPNLCSTRDLVDWHEFIRRTPEEYERWFDAVAKECEIIELQILDKLKDKKDLVFVDTNISIETLKRIARPDHVLVMLSSPDTAVKRFFERPDREKQFLYRLIMEEKDPVFAMANYKEGLTRINSVERYNEYLNSGFKVILRNDERSIEETLALVEKSFSLTKPQK